MTSLPVPVAPAEVQDNEAIGHLPQALVDALNAAREFALGEKADRTRKGYASDFRDFVLWCVSIHTSPLPAEPATVAAYLASLVDRKLKASTISRRLAAIRHAHKLKGFESPTSAATVQSVHRGIRRRIGARPEQKMPATAKAMWAMLKRIDPNTLRGKRDKALLLIGFAAALRRSELVALQVEDIEKRPEGVFIHVRKSKTDQEGRGHAIPVPNGSRLRPVEALDDWLKAAGIAAGPVFRQIRKGGSLQVAALTDQSVALIVKRHAKAARLDPTLFSGHSLRAGFVTSALESGADVFAAADQGRWRKLETVREYDRRAKAFKSHAGSKFL